MSGFVKTISFKWYVKKRVLALARADTLDIRTLAEETREENTGLRELLVLYVSAYTGPKAAKVRLARSDLIAEYGAFYHESGYPPDGAWRTMPDEYRRIYEAYQAEAAARGHVRCDKEACRERIIDLVESKALSIRAVARETGLDASGLCRFLHKRNNDALSVQTLRDMIRRLEGKPDGDGKEVGSRG